MLQQSRDIQDKELARLKAEALSLAARTAATVISNSVGSPAGAGAGGHSSRPSSSGSADGAHVSQLQAQLTRLQRELTAAQADRLQLQEQLAHLAAGSNSSSGVSDTD
jgi:hypothetical protein